MPDTIKNVLFILLLAIQLNADVGAIELPALYSDHMVLQRQHLTTIKGKAKPNSQLTMQLGRVSLSTEVNDEGNWYLVIPPQPAGGPFELVLKNDSDQLRIKDLYFGDVWLASGQSNMEWKLKWQVDNWQAEVKDSNYPLIRYFDVQNRYLATEQTKLQSGEWKLASENVAGEFSAVAWFFAKKLHLEKDIPIAIIDSTWGGTPAEAWTPMKSLLSQPGYKDSAAELLKNPMHWDQVFRQTKTDEGLKNQLLNSQNAARKIGLVHYDDKHWQTVSLPLESAVNNILWVRNHFTLSASDINAGDANFHLGYYSPHTQVYVNGQAVSQKPGAQKGDPFWIPQRVLKVGKNVLAIRSANAWDNRVNLGHKNKIQLVTGNHNIALNEGWKMNNGLEGNLPMPEKYWQKTSVLYNAMIHPIIHYPLKGVIWYQGESNIDRANEYRDLFTNMIESWRARWGQSELPFIFAQLASMHAQRAKPMESAWALLREAQTQSLSLPHTAMVVLLDAGEAYDIHPRNKQIVGERMWHAANAIAYEKGSVYSGPSAKNFRIKDNRLMLTFDHIGSGLKVSGEHLVGFEIADEKGTFVNAKAHIEEDQVIVWADNVNVPTSVRYGWADNSPANLYNVEGFPAIPFRMGK